MQSPTPCRSQFSQVVEVHKESVGNRWDLVVVQVPMQFGHEMRALPAAIELTDTKGS
jgi:hypothetical protein